ncbi:MAG: hypothetical protein LQ338_006071 [Usnochroma carphineum]|nr:MAG: hypothetical protein LQ338_006071 [Usnochroma carphineum]
MSYTQMIMAPTLPFQTGLECIGSVAANFGRTEAEEEHAEYIRLISESRESEHLLRDCGKAVHDNYLALLKAETEKAQLDDKKRRNPLVTFDTSDNFIKISHETAHENSKRFADATKLSESYLLSSSHVDVNSLRPYFHSEVIEGQPRKEQKNHPHLGPGFDTVWMSSWILSVKLLQYPSSATNIAVSMEYRPLQRRDDQYMLSHGPEVRLLGK